MTAGVRSTLRGPVPLAGRLNVSPMKNDVEKLNLELAGGLVLKPLGKGWTVFTRGVCSNLRMRNRSLDSIQPSLKYVCKHYV